MTTAAASPLLPLGPFRGKAYAPAGCFRELGKPSDLIKNPKNGSVISGELAAQTFDFTCQLLHARASSALAARAVPDPPTTAARLRATGPSRGQSRGCSSPESAWAVPKPDERTVPRQCLQATHRNTDITPRPLSLWQHTRRNHDQEKEARSALEVGRNEAEQSTRRPCQSHDIIFRFHGTRKGGHAVTVSPRTAVVLGQRSKVSRLQRDANATIVCEDNLKFMRKLEAESINLVVTSPPYNLGKEYEQKRSQERYIEEQAACIAEAVRLLHPSGSICWQVGNHVQNGEIFPLDIVLYPLFKNHGLQLRNRIVWTFGHGLHCQKRFSGRHETILWFTKSDDYTFNLDPVRVPPKYPEKKHFKGPNKGKLSSNPLGKNPTDVWDIPNVKSNHVEKTDHPCQFPVGLVERLVLSLTNPGESILDPYMGVGSTAIAALKHGRNAYGCDLDESYVDIAWERVHRLRAGELRTRPMNKPVYDPTAKEAE